MTTVANVVALSAKAISTTAIQLAWAFEYTDDSNDPSGFTLTLTDTVGKTYLSTNDLSAPPTVTASSLAPNTRYTFTIVLRYSDGHFTQQNATAQTLAAQPTPIPPPTPHPPPTPVPPPTPHPPPTPVAPTFQIAALTSVSQAISPPGMDTTYVVSGLAMDLHQHLYRITVQSGPNHGTWSAPGVLPGTYLFPTTPACPLSVTNINGFVSAGEIICALGTDQSAYAIINGLVPLGGKFQYSLVGTSWPNGRVDIFGISNSNLHMYQRTMLDGNFKWSSGWNDLGYAAFQPGSALSCGPNLIDIAGRDSDGFLKLFSYDGQKWNLIDLGFESLALPTLVSCAPGRLDVLASGMNKGLYHKSRTNGAWTGWELVIEAGVLANWVQPAAASWGPNRLDVVVVGATNGSLFHKHYDGQTWSPSGQQNWITIAGNTFPDVGPSLCAPAVNWMELFIKGTDKNWYTNKFDGTTANGWTGWTQHPLVLL